MKKLLATLIAGIGVAAAAPASAAIIGGINFADLGNGTHLETATLAQTYVNAVGQTAQGYGYITTINGQTGNYCADGSNNCALYYHFHDYTVTSFTGGTVQFTGGVVDVYYSNAAATNLLTQSSPANLAFITGLTQWVRFTGHTFLDLNPLFSGTQTLNGFGSLTGATLSGFGAGQLDIDTSGAFGLAGVASFLDQNTIGDNLGGFSDIVQTSSFNNFVLNPFDITSGNARGCQTGNPTPGQWCYQGTANLRGSVPEPSTLALLGLSALLGGGLVRRRRKVGQ